MRLVSFSVENYRSITKAKRIDISGSTVLVGPNNEGKSNLVRGLVLAMQTLASPQRILSGGRLFFGIARPRNPYSWKRDFPAQLQAKKPDGETVIVLDFELDASEITEFQSEMKIKLDNRLSMQVTCGPATGHLAVQKRGRDGKILNGKLGQIAAFIRDRIAVEYIPAIRTAESAGNVVESLLERELSVVEGDPAYSAALKIVADLQRPILDNLSQSVRQTMVKFLPAIRDVRFEIEEANRFRALRTTASVIVDDGTPTELRYKGDGVQSLAALALMRHASERGASGRGFVIVVEEPESHLHPMAMHSLKGVLNELRSKHQLVLTTHSPVFVNREHASSNIIVNNTIAKPAKDMAEVREVLGVKASDNLQLAEVVLIVEGEEDRIALEAILRHKSASIDACFASRKFAIETLDGGSNLSYKASMLRDALLCTCYAFLDSDSAGKAAAKKATAQGVLSIGDITFATALDLTGESEIEDLYDPKAYRDLLFTTYGVDIDRSPKFKNTKKKWSDRMGLVFKSAGKQWDEPVKMTVKGVLARYIASIPGTALHPHRIGAIDSIVASLERHCD